MIVGGLTSSTNLRNGGYFQKFEKKNEGVWYTYYNKSCYTRDKCWSFMENLREKDWGYKGGPSNKREQSTHFFVLEIREGYVWQLNHEELERVRFFLSNMEKEQVCVHWHILVSYYFLLDLMSQIHPLSIIGFENLESQITWSHSLNSFPDISHVLITKNLHSWWNTW